MTTITGTDGNDSLSNSDTGVTINALGGDDTITDNGSASIIDGGAGDDTLNLDRSALADPFTLPFAFGSGTPMTASDGTVIQNIERLNLTTGPGDDSVSFSNLLYDTARNRTYDSTSGYYTSDDGNSWNAGAGNDTVTIDLSSLNPSTSFGGDPTNWNLWTTITNTSVVAIVMSYSDWSATEDTLLTLTNVENYNITGVNGDGNTIEITSSGTNSLTGGNGSDWIAIGGTGNFVVDGADESDTLYFTPAVTSGVTVDLSIATAQTVGGGLGSVTLTSIENLWGTPYDDTLIGNSGDNIFNGGAGDDIIIGGGGSDTASYHNAASGVTVDLTITGPQAVGSDQGTDTLISIENLTGSPYDDTLTGDSGDNILNGGAGDDVLVGNDGHDVFIGGAGNDTMTGTWHGGSTVDYSSDTQGFTMTMDGGSATGSGIGSDTLQFIESVIGGSGNDTIYGHASAGSLIGNNGDDSIYDQGGIGMTLDGGSGVDYLNLQYTSPADFTITSGSATTVTLPDGTNFRNFEEISLHTEGGGHNVTFVGLQPCLISGADINYWYGGSGVDAATVDMSSSANHVVTVFDNSSYMISETIGNSSRWVIWLRAVETFNIKGSAYGDSLIGLGGNDTLAGNAGNDTLRGGAGNDLLDGGDGTDTASYIDATSGATVSLAVATAQAVGGGLGSDTLTNIENLTGSAYNDVLTGNSGDNVLDGDAGDDTLNGGDGTDTAVFSGKYADYTITPNLDGSVTVSNSVDGTDTLRSIERLQFSDKTMAMIVGTDGNDTLTNSDAGVTIYALGGDDTITDSGTASIIDGGAGNDWLKLDRSALTSAVALTFTPGATSAVALPDGTSFNNIERLYLTTGSGNDNIVFDIPAGYAANPYIVSWEAGAGNDTATADMSALAVNLNTGFSGDGHYQISANSAVVLVKLGGVENINIAGGTGADNLIGGSGNDSFLGNGGNDTLRGAGGTNVLTGGDGNDSIFDSGAGSTIDGGPGTDYLSLDRSALSSAVTLNFVHGSATAATLPDGTTFRNIEVLSLTTGSGNDNVTFDKPLAGLDHDWWDGGAGNDTATVNLGTENVAISALASGSNYQITETAGAFLFYFENVESYHIIGGSGADTLTSGDGNDTLDGGAGNDTLDGGTGTNTISGGGGNDTIRDWGNGTNFNQGTGSTIDGGAGEDSLLLYRGDVTSAVNMIFTPGSSIPMTLADGTSVRNIEHLLVVTGSGNDNVTYNGVQFSTVPSLDHWDASAGNDTLTLNLSSYTTPLALNGVINGAGDVFTNGVAFFGFTGVENFNITGGTGNDTLIGSSGNDTISGGDGDDNIDGGSGNNVLSGGNGNDFLASGSGNDTISGGSGTDTVSYGNATGGVTVSLAIATAQAVGGGMGTDTLSGIENIWGSNYNDVLTGDAGNNTFYGSGGNNTFDGGTGDDTFNGGLGSNTVTYQDASGGVAVNLSLTTPQAVGGGAGTDTLLGIQNLTGSAYNDTLTGDANANVLTGGAGNDMLNGGGGADTLIGGAGNDAYIVDNTGDVVTEAANAGTDTVKTTLASYTLGANVENLTYTGTGNFAGTGNSLANTITGGAGHDTLAGGAGNDTIFAGPGDTVDGGTGTDTAYIDLSVLNAGLTNPTTWWFTHFSPTSVDLYKGVNGNSTPTHTQLMSLSNVENFVLTGTSSNDIWTLGRSNYTIRSGGFVSDEDVGPDWTDYPATGGVTIDLALRTAQAIGGGYGTLTLLDDFTQVWGTPFADTLSGDSLNNTLLSFGGNDRLDGRAGTDTVDYSVMSGGVTVDLRLQNTAQVVDAAGDKNFLVSIENLTGSNYADTLIGDAGANVLTGGAGNDTLDGGAGADTLIGGAGNDTYIVDNTGDVVTEDANAGTDTVKTTLASYTLGPNVENLTFTGKGNFVGTGNTLANTITGGAGNDTLNGGAGNDTISFTGGQLTAADKVDGGAGTDTVVLNSDYTGTNALVMNATTLLNVETLTLSTGHSYNLTTNNATVASGQTLTINGAALGVSNVLTFNGAAETNGHFIIIGGNGADNLRGGALSDTFDYSSAAQSTSTHYDTITGLNFGADSFDIPGGAGVITGINAKVTSGSLSTSTFDANLKSAISSSRLGAHHAVLFTPNGGTLKGQTFLVVDLNVIAGYQAGADLVIRMNATSGTLAAGGFH